MQKWYMVKENWKNIEEISATYGMNYIGLGGDVWPDQVVNNVYKEVEVNRSYIDLVKDGETICINVLTEPFYAVKYFDYLDKKNKPIVIEVVDCCSGSKNCIDGYDFGNPEGGYSIIETELILRKSEVEIKTYLNEFGLFKSISIMEMFLNSIKKRIASGVCEEIGSYVPVGVRLFRR